jgi:hypothetical protein
MVNGITEDTPNRFLIDAGAIYIGYTDATNPGTLVGATRGGNTFTIETEYKEMALDGAKGPVKGCRRITKVTASMKVNLVEITTANILLGLPGATSADFPTVTPTHDQIKRSLNLALTDYKQNIALVGEISGTTQPFVGILKNVICDSGFELGATDNEEGVLALTFKAHFDPANMDEEPWEIRMPKEAA